MRLHQQLTRSHPSPLVSRRHSKHRYNVERHHTNLQLLLHRRRTAMLPRRARRHPLRLDRWEACRRLVTLHHRQASLPLLGRHMHPHQRNKCHLRQLHRRQGVHLKALPALVLQVDRRADRHNQTRDLVLLSRKALRQLQANTVSETVPPHCKVAIQVREGLRR
jgi:hypothetical protein